jgi:cell division protein FtsX
MQPTSFWFRTFIVLSFFLGLAGLVADAILMFSSSETLFEVLQEEIDNSGKSITLLGMLYSFVVLIIGIVGILGFFFFKRWGRALMLFSWVPITLLSMVFIREPWLISTVSYGFYTTSAALFGAALVMAYWTPVKERFEPKIEKQESG